MPRVSSPIDFVRDGVCVQCGEEDRPVARMGRMFIIDPAELQIPNITVTGPVRLTVKMDICAGCLDEARAFLNDHMTKLLLPPAGGASS